jgi:hypothetical protein
MSRSNSTSKSQKKNLCWTEGASCYKITSPRAHRHNQRKKKEIYKKISSCHLVAWLALTAQPRAARPYRPIEKMTYVYFYKKTKPDAPFNKKIFQSCYLKKIEGKNCVTTTTAERISNEWALIFRTLRPPRPTKNLGH